MIVSKFKYEKCPRTNFEGSRHYCTPDGFKVPSVTTILSKTVPEEKKKVLSEWRERVGVEKAQQITTEAANRGTKMHKYLEDYVEQDVLAEKPTNPFSWASHAMAQTIISEGLIHVDEFWGSEVPVYYPGIYAGTTDLVGVHSGEAAIMDHKQSNRWKKDDWVEDYYLQLVAYAEAHNEVHKTDIRKGVVFMAVKPKQDERTLEILEPPKYQQFTITGDRWEEYRQKWWDRVELYYNLKAQEEKQALLTV